MDRYLQIGTNNGVNVMLDLEKSMNRHIAITGKSGSGKTVALQVIARELVCLNKTVVIFDIHNAFKKENLYPGMFEDTKPLIREIDAFNDGIRCPLFEPFKAKNNEVESTEKVKASVTEMLTRIFKLKERQEEAVRDAVEEMIENEDCEEKSISTLIDILYQTGNPIAKRLDAKMRGLIERRVFRSGNDLFHEGKINIIRLSQFDALTQMLATELILGNLWRRATVADGFNELGGLYVLCDECHNLDLSSGGTINKILLEGRKMGINLIFATSESVVRRKDVSECVEKTALRLYFAPNGEDVHRLARRIVSLGGNNMELVLNRLKTGECLAVGDLTINEKMIKRPLKLKVQAELM